MILTTIYRVAFRSDEFEDMNEFDKTAEANGYHIIGEDLSGRTYEFRKEYIVNKEYETDYCSWAERKEE